MEIESLIYLIRGNRVIFDVDLANIYGVSVKRLNEQVKRNIERFPADFMFQLTDEEVDNLRSQIATTNLNFNMRRNNPRAFTEHGAIMVANILNSKIAINASILLIRIFIKMRSFVSEQEELKKKLQNVEVKLVKYFANYENELQEIRFLISQLEQPLQKIHRKIGFGRE